MQKLMVALLLGLAGPWLTGCGSSGDGRAAIEPIEAGSSEGGRSVLDAGDELAGYPAFPPEMPQVQNQGGAVLKSPRVVTVTFASDPNASDIQTFADKLGTSSYWQALGEYGVGAFTSTAADHVVVQTPLATGIDTGEIDVWVQTQIRAAPGNGWPAPDAETVYAVYVPDSVKATSGGQDACVLGAGYHTDLSSPSVPGGVSYAQILESCYALDGVPRMDDITDTASHEIAEATTDPFPNHGQAFINFDADHLAWEMWNVWQDELADGCEDFDDAYYRGGADEPFSLARLWSNASAKAGHNPCVPLPGGAYTTVTPLGLQPIHVTAVVDNPDGTNSVRTFDTKGWRIAPGATATVKIGFNSDAPSGAWSVTASEGDCCSPSWANVLTVTPTTLSGKNGDTADVTIQVNQAPARGTAALLTFTSVADHIGHPMPVIVGTY